MARTLRKAELQELLKNLVETIASSGVLSDIDAHDDLEQHFYESSRPSAANGKRIHRLGKETICATDERGYATPGDADPNAIVLDASEGFIPLWRYGTTLRWCFDESALAAIDEPTQRKREVRELMREAMLAWGDAAPIKLREEREAYDFRVVVNARDRGGVLASAFFPDSGRHDFHVYPLNFEQTRKEQVDTFTHELGHIFGLRHFFANLSERAWPSEIFGKHRPFSIMNYGDQSELTEDDRSDLRELYRSVWSGTLASVNGTPIRLFAPYHEAGTRVTPRFYDTAAAIRE